MNLIPYFLILDSFGINMTFYLRGFKDYRSHLGGFVTLSIYVISIICAVIFAQEFWKKSTPKISTASSIYPNPTKLKYPDDIFFMFTLSVDSMPFVDNKIYRPIGHIRTKINGTQSFLEKNISLEICSNIFNESYKYYESIKHLNLSNFYCLSLDREQNEEIFINEFWGNDGFQMLQIKVYNCSALAQNNSECETDDIIREKLTSPIITYYTLNNYIDTNNYKNPYVRGLKDNFYYVSYKKFFSATQYLKHVQIHSDIGLLFSNIEINSDNTIDSMVEYSENDQEDGKIFTMSIQLTNKIDIYSRSYYKIQDLGADVGAIYGALHMVFAILFQFYNNSKLFTNIINNFFLIKEDFEPMSREKKIFLNLKTKFYNDLKLNISFEGKNSFSVTKNDKKSNDEYMKTNDPLNNENMRKIMIKNDIMHNIIETKDNYIYNLKKNEIQNDEINKKNYILKVLKNKREEEKKRIRIDFSCIDRIFCLYFIDLCRNRVNRYSFYNLFYKGKDYIIKVLDITNYLKYNHFLQMFFLINGKEKQELYDYITTPILSSKYVGPRFEAEK